MDGAGEVLVGEHVDLRPLTPGDAEATFRWRSGGRAGLLNAGADSVEAQARWIERRPASERNYVIALKSGEAVGMLSLVDIDTQNSRAETGRFLIGEEERVKGVPAAVEAMKLLYDHAFNELVLSRLYGTVAAANTRMIKWQKFLGMKEEGRLRRHYRIGGEFQDAVCLGILKPEYEAEFLPKARVLMKAAKAA